MALRPDKSQDQSDKLAARKAAESDVLLREVDDALREDEMASAAKRFGIPIAIGVVAILLGLAGYLWWDGSQKSSAAERSEQFTIALDEVEHGRLDAGDKALAPLAASDADGTRAAATLMRAGVALEQSKLPNGTVSQAKRDQAAKLFAQVAADNGAPQPYRDLAMIREVAVRFDTMPPQQVVDKLKPLAVPGNAWMGSAGELLGMAYLKQGKVELAGPLFASVARDKNAPETLRARARQMAGLLGVDAVDDAEKVAAGQGSMAQ